MDFIIRMGWLPLLIALAQPAAASVCKISTVKYKTAVGDITTTSPTFVDIPFSGVYIKTDTSDTCIIVRFSVDVHHAGGGDTFVQVVLDGTTVASPGPFEWGATAVSSFEFIFPGPFTPGVHTINVQWRSEGDVPEDYPQWGVRSLTVTY